MVGPSSAPSMVVWEITSSCNLSCIYCYIGDKNQEQYSYRDSISTLEILNEFGVKRIVFSGGEPLLHPRIFEILHRASRYGFETVLATNATLVKDEAAKALRKSGLGFVQVSLDGDEARHDQLRGQGSFRRSVEGIEALNRAGCHLVVRFTAGQKNISGLSRVEELCKSLGVALDIGLLTPTGFGRLTDLPSPGEFFGEIDKLFGRGNDNGVIESSLSCHPLKAYAHRPLGKERRCLAGTDLALISCSGKFIPCPYISGGNSLVANGHTFRFPDFGADAKSTWLTDPLFKVFRDTRCEDCPILSMSFAGDTDGMDPYGVSAYHAWKGSKR